MTYMGVETFIDGLETFIEVSLTNQICLGKSHQWSSLIKDFCVRFPLWNLRLNCGILASSPLFFHCLVWPPNQLKLELLDSQKCHRLGTTRIVICKEWRTIYVGMKVDSQGELGRKWERLFWCKNKFCLTSLFTTICRLNFDLLLSHYLTLDKSLTELNQIERQ